MMRLLKPFLKLPKSLNNIRFSLNKNNYNSVNLYFQDESRFGLLTHVGSSITAKGVRPIVKYQHRFSNTYLYGSYSPIDGDSFVYEINGVSCSIFAAYLNALSKHRPNEAKILVIDNAGFHSTKNISIPNNIILLRIPPYSPELNPCEQVWAWIKKRYKNHIFEDMESLKTWLHQMVISMSKQTIKSIVGNHHFLNAFNAAFST